MKKLILTILILAMILPQATALAANVDWKSMSDQEITDTINAGRIELASRMPENQDHITIVNQDGIEIYLTGKYTVDDGYSNGSIYIRLEAVVVNGTDVVLNITDNGTCINGWNVDTTGIYDTPAGRKQKDNITVRISDADITSFDEITDIEFVLTAYEADNYSNRIELAPFTYVK